MRISQQKLPKSTFPLAQTRSIQNKSISSHQPTHLIITTTTTSNIALLPHTTPATTPPPAGPTSTPRAPPLRPPRQPPHLVRRRPSIQHVVADNKTLGAAGIPPLAHAASPRKVRARDVEAVDVRGEHGGEEEEAASGWGVRRGLVEGLGRA